MLVDWQLEKRHKEKEERLLYFDHDQNESREALMREERKMKKELVACLPFQTLSKDRLWANLCPLLLSFNHCLYLSYCSTSAHSIYLLTALIACKIHQRFSLHSKLLLNTHLCAMKCAISTALIFQLSWLFSNTESPTKYMHAPDLRIFKWFIVILFTV